MSNYFPAAPWPAGLKFSSVAGALLVVILFVVVFRSFPATPGPVQIIVALLLLCLLAIPVWCALLIVRGYEIDGDSLLVHRPLWKTRVAIKGLNRVETDAEMFQGARRIFGNSGLFGFVGLYLSKSLGRFRLFATDLGRPVILLSTSRTVVITPESPQAVVDALRQRIAADAPAKAAEALGA